MTKSSAYRIRIVLHVFLGVASVILATGGGRFHKIDFLSLDAWVAVALVLALVLFYAKEPILIPSFARARDKIASHPLAFTALIFSLLFLTHLTRFLTLHVGVFDAGFLYQGIFNAFRNPILKCDVCFNETYLGAHSAFTLALFSPLASLLGTPLGIPFLQALVGFGCFWLISDSFRREIGKRHLAFVFFLLLASRGIRESFIFDFREDLVGAFFFILAFMALKAERPILALVPFLLAALSKETAAILLPFAMIAGLYAQGRPRRNLLILYAIFSVAVFAIVFFGILPRWTPSGGSGSDLAKRLIYLGSTPQEIFLNLGSHPFKSLYAIFSNTLTLERLKYLLVVAAPVTLIAFRALNFYYLPGYVLLIGNFLSVASTQRMMQFHYEILLIPFFGFGLCESIRKLQTQGQRPRSFFTLSLLAALSLSGTWPLSHFREYLRDSDRIADVLWARNCLSEIPAKEVVLGDSLTFPLLTDRENLRLLGNTPDEKKSGMSSLSIEDSRFAILQKINGETGLGPDWAKIDCGPKEILCRFEKR